MEDKLDNGDKLDMEDKLGHGGKGDHGFVLYFTICIVMFLNILQNAAIKKIR